MSDEFDFDKALKALLVLLRFNGQFHIARMSTFRMPRG
jgi:hypothetical protein